MPFSSSNSTRLESIVSRRSISSEGSRYRALRIEFCGYDDSRNPIVAVEVEFAVSME